MGVYRDNRAKYNARKVYADGVVFDSRREYAVYQELKLLERAEKINALQVHVPIVLHAHGADGIKRKIGHYEVDFKFFDCERKQFRYMDVKGFDVPLGVWKIKHAQAEYGITVEVRR